jgi:hypothetical protein
MSFNPGAGCCQPVAPNQLFRRSWRTGGPTRSSGEDEPVQAPVLARPRGLRSPWLHASVITILMLGRPVRLRPCTRAGQITGSGPLTHGVSRIRAPAPPCAIFTRRPSSPSSPASSLRGVPLTQSGTERGGPVARHVSPMETAMNRGDRAVKTSLQSSAIAPPPARQPSLGGFSDWLLGSRASKIKTRDGTERLSRAPDFRAVRVGAQPCRRRGHQ